MSSTPDMEIAGKLNLSTKEAIYVLGSKRLFERLRAAMRLLPLETSRDLLFPMSDLLREQEKMRIGNMPPRIAA